MRRKKKSSDASEQSEFVSRVRREQAERQKTYREQALAMFPHVCARCGRAFSGPTLRELTVHHIDSNHMNNPKDGSNWELLCLYCHDNEHGAYKQAGSRRSSTVYSDDASGFRAFEGLKDMLEADDTGSDADDRQGGPEEKD